MATRATTVGPKARTSERVGAPDGNGSRPLPRRRTLLNGRAALGGLLVAVATVLLFSVAQRGTASSTVRS